MSSPRPTLPARAIARIRRSLNSSRTAASSLAAPAIADAAILVFFADGPAHLYQLSQWFAPLRSLAQKVPTAIVVANFDTHRQISRSIDLPVAFAPATRDLERTLGAANTRAVLYPNNHALNFRCLRYREPIHIFIGHGESDKGSSSSNQLRAYDYVLAAGEASKRRMEGIRFFDPDERVVAVGRPQTDGVEPPPVPDEVRAWQGDGVPVVLYAPTWEGDRPSMAYGSAESHGPAIINALLRDGAYHVVFRPHPSSGTVSGRYRQAVHDLAEKINRSGSTNFVDHTAFGWQIDFADYVITDVSAVAYDSLGADTPTVITVPTSDDVVRDRSDLLTSIPGLTADEAKDAAQALNAAQEQCNPDSPLHAETELLRQAYFGDRSPGAATQRFVSAVVELSGLGTDSPAN